MKQDADGSAPMLGSVANYPAKPDGWIPVTERLPGEDEKVVVYTEEGTHVAAVDEDGMWYPSHGDGWMFPVVSHWMPLPAPPKDGNSQGILDGSR